MTMFGSRFKQKKKSWKSNKRRDISRAIKVLGTIEMQPSTYVQLLTEIYTNPSFRYALLRNKTKFLYDELDYVTINKQNTFIFLQGKTGSGKSTAGVSLATYYIQKVSKVIYGTDLINDLILERPLPQKIPKIHLAYNNDQVTQKIPEVQNHEMIFRDESIKDRGIGSDKAKDAIENYFSIIRDRQVQTIYISPYVMSGRIAEMFKIYLWSIGYIKSTGENVCIWVNTDPRSQNFGKPHSVVYIKRLQNPRLENHMATEKNKMQDELIESGGYSYQQFKSDLLKKDYQKVIKYIDENPIYGRITQKAIFSKIYEIGIKTTDEKHIVALMGKIYNELNRRKEEEENKTEIKSISIDYNDGEDVNEDKLDHEIKLEKTIVDEHFRDIVLHQLEGMGVKKRDTAIIDRIATGETYRDIIDQLEISSTRIVKEVKDNIQQRFLGNAGEAAYRIRLNTFGYEYDHYGGNSPFPDFVVHSLKEIHSFKCYMLENDSKAIKHIAATEFLFAKKFEYKLKLVIYIMRENIFKIFDVSFQNDHPSDINGAENSHFVEELQQVKQKTPPISAQSGGGEEGSEKVVEVVEGEELEGSGGGVMLDDAGTNRVRDTADPMEEV